MRYTLLLFVVFLTACATAPQGALNYSEVTIPKPPEGMSTLVFYRKSTPPLAYAMQVHINNNPVVALPSNTFSYVHLNPGTANFKISWNPFSGMPNRYQKIEIPPDSQLFLELNSSVFLPSGIELGSGSHQTRGGEQAVKQLKVCCKYMPAKP